MTGHNPVQQPSQKLPLQLKQKLLQKLIKQSGKLNRLQ